MTRVTHEHVPAAEAPREKKQDTISQRTNKLRAAVLGANDGIVSVAATVIGVAAATPDNLHVIATAGFASLAAGAFSMAAGEYVSVSTQRDTERAIVERVRTGVKSSSESLRMMSELRADLLDRGISEELAERAAAEMYAKDPVRAISAIEQIDPDDLVSPWAAAFWSFFSFIAGAILPVAAILLFPQPIRIPATFAAVLLALGLTGLISAKAGAADAKRAAIRTIIGGAIGMAFTYGVGLLFNVNVG